LSIGHLIGSPTSIESGRLFACAQQRAAVAPLADGELVKCVD